MNSYLWSDEACRSTERLSVLIVQQWARGTVIECKFSSIIFIIFFKETLHWLFSVLTDSKVIKVLLVLDCLSQKFLVSWMWLNWLPDERTKWTLFSVICRKHGYVQLHHLSVLVGSPMHYLFFISGFPFYNQWEFHREGFGNLVWTCISYPRRGLKPSVNLSFW